jgi:ABC-type uncharacterized transport system YnjBCD permease subunit
MIRIGQLHLSSLTLLAAIATYAVAALALQLLVVAAFWFTPKKQRLKIVDKVHALLAKYANQAILCVSFVFGTALLINGCLGLLGARHF